MAGKFKKKYKRNKEASQFLDKNPEFAGWEIESTHDRPGNAQWACTEASKDKVEKAHTIQEALLSYPRGRERTALEMYFDGRDFGEIQEFLKHKLRGSTIKFIWKVKGRVMEHGNCKKRKKLNMKHRKVVAKNTFELAGETKSVYLVYTPRSKNYIWVDSDYRILPETVQDYLDMALVKKDQFFDEDEIFKEEKSYEK